MNRTQLIIGALLASLSLSPMAEAAGRDKDGNYCEPVAKKRPKAKPRKAKAKSHKAQRKTVRAAPRIIAPVVVPPAPAPIPQSTGNLQVSFQDDMGPSYKVVSYNFLLDGKPVLTGTQNAQTVTRAVATGNHKLTTEVVYRGNDPVFEYWNDYSFKMTSVADVSVKSGTKSSVRAVGQLNDGAFLQAEDRPDLKVSVQDAQGRVALVD